MSVVHVRVRFIRRADALTGLPFKGNMDITAPTATSESHRNIPQGRGYPSSTQAAVDPLCLGGIERGAKLVMVAPLAVVVQLAVQAVPDIPLQAVVKL